MCASGRVAMKSGRSASRAEFFTMGVCCFDAMRASSVGFSKTQGSTRTDCNLKAGQRFADVLPLQNGMGSLECKRKLKWVKTHCFQNQSLGDDFKCTFYLKSALGTIIPWLGLAPQTAELQAILTSPW